MSQNFCITLTPKYLEINLSIILLIKSLILFVIGRFSTLNAWGYDLQQKLQSLLLRIKYIIMKWLNIIISLFVSWNIRINLRYILKNILFIQLYFLENIIFFFNLRERLVILCFFNFIIVICIRNVCLFENILILEIITSTNK